MASKMGEQYNNAKENNLTFSIFSFNENCVFFFYLCDLFSSDLFSVQMKSVGLRGEMK
jgi:hypothetical protein